LVGEVELLDILVGGNGGFNNVREDGQVILVHVGREGRHGSSVGGVDAEGSEDQEPGDGEGEHKDLLAEDGADDASKTAERPSSSAGLAAAA